MSPSLAVKPRPLWEVVDGRLTLHLHPGQAQAWRSEKRLVFIISGTQSGKTSFAPFWLEREIRTRGPGDYLAVTSTYPLLKLKMLPEFLGLFRDTLRLGTWKAGDMTFVYNDGQTRVMFGSAVNSESLEAATAKAAWLDECLAPEIPVSTEVGPIAIGQIVNGGLSPRIWSFDIERSEWQLKPIIRYVKRCQRELMLRVGPLSITPNHRIWTREFKYLSVADILSVWYSSGKAGGVCHVWTMPAMPEAISGQRTKAVLQSGVFTQMVCKATGTSGEDFGASQEVFPRPSQSPCYIREAEKALLQPVGATMAPVRRTTCEPYGSPLQVVLKCSPTNPAVDTGREWPPSELATGKVGGCVGLAKRICSDNRQWLAASRLQDRCGRNRSEDRYRSRESGEPSQSAMVRGEWVDVSSFLEQDGRDMAGRLSSDGFVYNLEVEGNHNYIANGILVSNCGQDQFRMESWEAVLRRLSIHQGRVLGTTTPYNAGWLKQQIYDPWRRGDPDIDVIEFPSTTNPVFPREEFDRAERTLPTWRFNMFYRGQFDRPAGLIYSDFMDRYREEGGHLVKPFKLPPAWPRYAGIDFGAVNTALVWLAYDPDRDIYYIYRLSLEGGKTTGQHAAEALALATGVNMISWYGGSPGETQQRMDWRAAGVPIQDPPFGDVEAGIDRVIALFKARRLFVFDDLMGLRDELGTYSRMTGDDGQPTEKIRDKESFHRLDALRAVAIGVSRPGPGIHWLEYE